MHCQRNKRLTDKHQNQLSDNSPIQWFFYGVELRLNGWTTIEKGDWPSTITATIRAHSNFECVVLFVYACDQSSLAHNSFIKSSICSCSH